MVWCWRVREDRIIKDINLPFLLSFGHFVCPHGIDKMRINTNAITFCGDC